MERNNNFAHRKSENSKLHPVRSDFNWSIKEREVDDAYFKSS